MPLLVNDEALAKELLAARRSAGQDRHDEVWEGVYIMSPMANNEHQRLATQLAMAIGSVVDWKNLGLTLVGANVSDRREDWTHNYRVPDVLVFLNNCAAEDCGTHWLGGPDLAIEIVSEGDRTLDKLDFYGSVSTREVLVIDRSPWQLTLYRLNADSKLVRVAVSSSTQPNTICSQAIPVCFTIAADTACMRVSTTAGALIREISMTANPG